MHSTEGRGISRGGCAVNGFESFQKYLKYFTLYKKNSSRSTGCTDQYDYMVHSLAQHECNIKQSHVCGRLNRWIRKALHRLKHQTSMRRREKDIRTERKILRPPSIFVILPRKRYFRTYNLKNYVESPWKPNDFHAGWGKAEMKE